MAKDKDKDKPKRPTAAALIEKHGDKLVMTGDDFVAKPIHLISMSPAIDLQIGGGVPAG